MIFDPPPFRMPPRLTDPYANKVSRSEISPKEEAVLSPRYPARARAETAIPEPVVEVVQGAWPRPAMAKNVGSLPYPGL
ncbi:MAG: hypothetical protein LZF62_140056 [Nitrospira sp.]|nr:MAG: hypothetical protein LZF62_140056 [Nitrospira sp.]